VFVYVNVIQKLPKQETMELRDFRGFCERWFHAGFGVSWSELEPVEQLRPLDPDDFEAIVTLLRISDALPPEAFAK
jgi:hypothetical protein